ncbi:MAG: TlpA family protein disulfide reductase [Chitinophagales bacterium]|nr:TlpA family protein disulfide reductase [Chitinophagales bacterium]
MKLHLLGFCCSFFIACLAMAQNNANISGKIANASDKDTVLLIVDNVYLGEQHAQVFTTTMNDKGDFSFQFPLNQSRPVLLRYQKQLLPLFLSPNETLSLECSADSLLKTATYNGKAAENNQFYTQFNQKYGNWYHTSAMQTKIRSMKIDPFEMELYQAKQEQLKYIQQQPNFTKLSNEFRQYINHQINYNYWQWLFGFPIVTANADANIKIVLPLPHVMTDGFEDKVVDNHEALISPAYRGFLVYYTTYITSQQNGFNKFTDVSLSMDMKFNMARQTYKKPMVFSYIVSQYMLDYNSKLSVPIAKKVYEGVKESDKSNTYPPILLASCGDVINGKITTPTLAANTTPSNSSSSAAGSGPKLLTIDGKPANLSEFKGKVVYVDFWASWCGPCRQQMPFSHELPNKLSKKQQKQVVFLYISIDDTEERWKNAIEQNKIEGVNWLSPGGWNSEVCAYYKIQSIPRYMLIDKKGDIAESNAKRPSDEAIIKDIIQLINKK